MSTPVVSRSPSCRPSQRPLDGPALTASRVLAPIGAAGLAPLARFLEAEDYDPEAYVVREGETRRDMFFVLDGQARLCRGAIDLGHVHKGDHFGELGLIVGRPRAASVVATTPLVVAKLTRARYEAMSAEDPRLALRLTQTIIATLGLQLTELTDSVGVLLRERSLPRRTHVTIEQAGERRQVRTGTLLGELVPAEFEGAPVVAALVDKKAVSLLTPIASDAKVEPLTTAHWEGERIYRRSTGLLLLEAARQLDPKRAVRLGAPLGVAQSLEIDRFSEVDAAVYARRLEEAMTRLADADVPFRQEWWTVEEATTYFAERGWSEAVQLLRSWRESTVPLVTSGEVYAIGMGPLLPSTGLVRGFRVAPYDHGLMLHYGDDAGPLEPAAGVGAGASFAAAPQRFDYAPMVHEHERWLGSLGVSSVGDFNEACIAGEVSAIIRVAEGFHEKRISQIADAISQRGALARAICIAGPSSSGKTTFIKRLTTQLQVNGIRPVGLSLDDYYVDRERTPRDASGAYDYEALEALDLEALDGDLRRLMLGETVRTPRYDFGRGESQKERGAEVTLGPRDMLLLEGIHGLNPRLVGSALTPAQIFRVFVQPMTSLPFDRLNRVNPSDIRLLRRIVRDRHTRGATAADNILRWPAVRAGERAHIFPFIGQADIVFDTSLIYELSVLKVYAERYLLEIPQSHEAFTTAHRLRALIDQFVAIYPDHVPPTSIVREFIGGSGFEY